MLHACRFGDNFHSFSVRVSTNTMSYKSSSTKDVGFLKEFASIDLKDSSDQRDFFVQERN